MGLTSGGKMAAAVGVSLRRGFPATSLGRVSLQVSPGALVRLGIVPVTEAAWVERPRRSRESPGPGLSRGLLTCALSGASCQKAIPCLAVAGELRPGGGWRRSRERQRSGRTSESLKVVCWNPESNPYIWTRPALCDAGRPAGCLGWYPGGQVAP